MFRYLLFLFLLILVVSCKDERADRFNEFVRKCLASHPKPPFRKPRIEVKEAPGMGYGTFATQDIDAEQIYMFMPYKCVMSDDKARKELGNERVQGLDDFHVLLLYLLREKSKGKNSFFYPYLEVVPKSFDIPYFWSDEELKQLQGSEILPEVYAERQKIRNMYTHLKKNVLDRFPNFFKPAKAYSFEEYEWANFMMNSRTIWTTNGGGKRALIPLLDTVNCKEGPNPDRLHTSTRDLELDAVVTRAPWSFKSGEQVFENYGSDNHNNFYYHGFTLVDNSHNCATIKVEYRGSDKSVLEQLQRNNYKFCISRKKVPPIQLMDAIAKSSGYASGREYLRSLIQKKLAAYPTTMDQDTQLAQSYIVPPRAQSAHLFLREEKKVLQQVLQMI